MPETITRRQTRIIHPETISVSGEAPGVRSPTRRSRRRGEARRDDDATRATDALLNALVDDDNIEIVDDFDLTIDDSALDAPEARRRGDHDSSDDVPAIKIEVDVEADENAVVLIESDGVYVWQLPTVKENAPRRRGSGTATGRTLSFTIDASSPEAPNGGSRRRGAERRGRRGLIDWVAKNVFGRVRTVVLKFVARKAVGAAGRYLERNVKPGLIAITGKDSSKWVVGSASPTPSLPTGAPARILLMIHGTFSSTLGSFGALAGTEAGGAFLDGALSRYDAILAYDHATLGAWPMENAKDILDALKSLGAPAGTEIDLVAFSRGGLVARLLSEELLPGTAGEFVPGKAVFVGCTNGGTALADQENWKTLLDIMTNLAVAAGRGLTFLGAGVAGKIIEHSVKTLGTFVQAIVDAAVTDEMVPGIAAMSPGSDLVKRLNDPNADPGDHPSAYFAIGSDFEPKLFSSDAASPLSKRLLRALADLGVDALMKETNDLVVDNEAMTQFGAHKGRLAEELFWEENAAIFHTNYFAQAEVAQAIHEWLLEESAETSETVAAAPPTVARPKTFQAKNEISEILPDLDRLRRDALVVIERPRHGYYVLKAADVKERARHAHPDDSLIDALDLHESDVADIHEGSGLLRAAANGVVRLEGDKVVEAAAPANAASEEPAAPSPGGATAASAPPIRRSAPRPSMRGAATPPRQAARRGRRSSGTAEEAAPSDDVAENAICHFAAEMPKSVPLDQTADLTVTVSREEIETAAGMAAGTGSKTVRLADPIKLIVTAVRNCIVEGDDEIAVDVPKEGDPDLYVFSIRGKKPGAAELKVFARQGPKILARITLQPEFIAVDETVSGSMVVNTREADPPKIELTILEDPSDSGNSYRLRFILESDELGLRQNKETTDLRVPRERYISSLNEKLEGEWGSGVTFEQFMFRLQAFGATLYEELIPEAIRQTIWDYQDEIGCIEIITDEPFIPWEALHIVQPGEPLPIEGNKFLAELGLVRWINDQNPAPTTLPFRAGRLRHVVPDYVNPDDQLEGAKKERAMLDGLFENEPVEASSMKVAGLLNQPGAFDLLHFACHGVAERGQIWDASLLMAGSKNLDTGRYADDTLTVNAIEQHASLNGRDGARPIVFLNACQAGKAGRSLTGTGGMAQAFVKSGAGLFVSSLWSIGDGTALTFAETFYREMLDGKTTTQAIKAARTESKKAEEPTWLAYTVYGHPYARLTVSDG